MGMATSTEVDKYLFVICGTPGYVAPEVANLKDINIKYGTICDVFSAGAVFYKMLNFYLLYKLKKFNALPKIFRLTNKELFKGKNIKETF
jgi:serine/threonine protein kinase